MNKLSVSLVLLLAAAADVLFAYLVLGQGWDSLYEEGNLLESMQAAFLATGALVFALAASLADKRRRLVFLSCFLLCLTFLLREVDVQDYPLPAVVVMLGSGAGRNLMLLAGWLSIAALVALDPKGESRTIRDSLFSSAGILMMVGGFFVILGSLFDGQLIGIDRYAFYEELAELNGHFLMLQSALAGCWSLRGMAASDRQHLEPHLT